MSDKECCDVLVVGGGASGMMAAVSAAQRGRSVILVEKNEKLGKKLYITGKGRCNLTNNCTEPELLSHITSNSKFMYSSIRRFSNEDVMTFFEDRGLKLKTERGGRVFPESDHSSDVIKTLAKELEALGVDIRLNTAVRDLLFSDNENSVCTGASVIGTGRRRYEISSESTVVATGGLSYPATGSTGDGYYLAKKAGLEVNATSPGLVPFGIEGDICRRLQGLTLKNIKISVTCGEKTVFESVDTGEMLFTHFGVSGPLILTASSEIDPKLYEEGLILHIDLKPALSYDELDDRLIRDFREVLNKEYRNSLKGLLPSKLIPVITELSGIEPNKKVNAVTARERAGLVKVLKDMSLKITGTRGFEEAVITKGGISVKELDPKTFVAKRVKGLYFTGEVIDVDAHTGGFNLQIAWSSGYAAGSYA